MKRERRRRITIREGKTLSNQHRITDWHTQLSHTVKYGHPDAGFGELSSELA